VVHARAALIQELLDEAIRPHRRDDLELQQAVGDRHERALLVAELVVRPLPLQRHTEEPLLDSDLLRDIRHGHRDVVHPLEPDEAAAGGLGRGIFPVRDVELVEDAAAVTRVDVGDVLADATEGLDAERAHAGGSLPDVPHLDRDVVEPRPILVQETLHEALRDHRRDDLELDICVADVADAAVEIFSGFGGEVVQEAETEHAFQPGRLGLPVGVGHGDVVDAVDGDHARIRGGIGCAR
jgi:hypothetical protein